MSRSIFILFFALSQSLVFSQQDTVSQFKEVNNCLFYPKPIPECDKFLITEIGYFRRLDSPPYRTITVAGQEPRKEILHNFDQKFYFTSDLGIMQNINDKFGAGIVHMLRVDDGGLKNALKLRGRHWINKDWSLDVEAGTYLFPNNFGDFIGTAQINLNDMLSVSVMYERYSIPSPFDTGVGGVQYDQPSHENTFLIGAKFGSVPGAVINGIAVAGAAFLGAYIIFVGGGD